MLTFGGVTLTSPGSGSSVQNPVHFVASATTGCSKGIAAVGIYDEYKLVTVSKGSKLGTDVYLSSGTHNHTTVQSWDNCGGVSKVHITLKVTSKTFYSLEQGKGWLGYGELPPSYDVCTDCRPLVEWGMKQGITSPVLNGTSTRFDLGGSLAYSDALWVNHVIGDGSTQGLLDASESLTDSIHNLVYDAYFYSPSSLSTAHALEFDIGQYSGGHGFMFGTMCRTEANKQWAVWDNPNHKWVNTGVVCDAVAGKWNHLVLRFHRTSDNHLLYQSITLNGSTHTLNWSNNSIYSNWHGIVVNFQLDGNGLQKDFSAYLDNLHVTYY
jgi:hypothetical protein